MLLSFFKGCFATFAGLFAHSGSCCASSHSPSVAPLIDPNDPVVKVMAAVREQYYAKALRASQRYMFNTPGLIEVRWDQHDSFAELKDSLFAVVVPLGSLPVPGSYTEKTVEAGTIIQHFLWDGKVLSPFYPREDWTIGVGSLIEFKAA